MHDICFYVNAIRYAVSKQLMQHSPSIIPMLEIHVVAARPLDSRIFVSHAWKVGLKPVKFHNIPNTIQKARMTTDLPTPVPLVMKALTGSTF